MQRRTSVEIWSAVTALVVTGALTAPLWAAAPASPEQVGRAAPPRSDAVAVGRGDGCADALAAPGEVLTGAAAPTRPADAAGVSAAGSSAGSSAGVVTQSIAVVVPPTAIVRLDDRGRVVAAMTNTGCPPAASDEVWHQRPDGTLERAPDGAADHPWTGDFTERGVFVAQRDTSA